MTTADLFNVGKVLTGPPGPNGEPGKLYTQRKADQYMQGEFQRWLEQRAHDAVDRRRADQDSKDREHVIIANEAALGKYEFNSPRGVEAQWLPAGMCKVLTITMRDQGVNDEIAEYLVDRFLREIVADFAVKKNLPAEQMPLLLLALSLGMDWTPSAESGSSSTPFSAPLSPDPSTSSDASTTSNSTTSTPSVAAPTE